MEYRKRGNGNSNLALGAFAFFVLLLLVFGAFGVVAEESSESNSGEESGGSEGNGNDDGGSESSEEGPSDGESGNSDNESDSSGDSSESEDSGGNSIDESNVGESETENIESPVEEGETVEDGEIEEEFEYVDIEEVNEELEDGGVEEELVVEEETYVELEEIIELPEEPESFDEDDDTGEIGVEEDENGVESVSAEENSGSDGGSSGGRGSGEDEVVEEEFEYVDIEEVNEELEEGGVEKEGDEEKKEIRQVFYKGNKKEIETTFVEGEEVEISKEEDVLLVEEDLWKKEVKVYSEEHFDNELRVFADVPESEDGRIAVYWREEDKKVSFEEIDDDGDGKTDRISWIVPHLSEQNFEIIIEYDSESVSAEGINVEVGQAPSGNLTSGQRVEFSFEVNKSNSSSVSCDFDLGLKEGVAVRDENITSEGLRYNVSLSNGDYEWTFRCYEIQNISVEDSASGEFGVYVDYTPVIEFSVDDSSIDEGDIAKFEVNITAFVNKSVLYLLDKGDGSSVLNSGGLNVSELYAEIEHNYTVNGSYSAGLTVFVDGISYERSVNVVVSDTNTGDSQNPEITLVDPEDEETISEDQQVDFIYEASDDSEIANCTFSLYYYNDSIIGTLVYSKFNDSIVHGSRDKTELVNFDEGEYSWDVECHDSSNNYRSKSRDFVVDFSYENTASGSSDNDDQETNTVLKRNYEGDDEVDELLEAVNGFLEKEGRLGAKEKEALEDLGFLGDIKFNKKRLLQIELDLSHNINYIRGDDRKEQRREEIEADLDEIRKTTPVDLKVEDSYEFQKNSLDFDLEEVVGDYISSSGIVLNSRGIKSMAKLNEELQGDIGILTRVKHVEVEYLDRSEKFTLVVKEISVKNDSFESLLEIFPEGGFEGSVGFDVENKEINEEMHLVRLSDLEENRLVYRVSGFKDLKEFEKTETIAFNEEIPKNGLGGITGFAVALPEGGSFLFYMSWFFVGLLAFGILGDSVRRVKMTRLKKKPGVKEVFGSIRKAKESLKKKEIEVARDHYKNAQEKYGEIPSKAKKIAYKHLKIVQGEIDKRDMGNLIKEFMAASKEGNKDYALQIYGDIKTIYSRMPSGMKQKVYDKVMPQVKGMGGSV